jgi:hypothetical protein
VDLHHLLLAGLPAHFESYMPSHAVRSPAAKMCEPGNAAAAHRVEAQMDTPQDLPTHP